VALEFSTVVTQARGRARAVWLTCGALAMGIGIWSMHFVGMIAFEMPGMEMAYDLPLMLLSVAIAIGASWLALYIVSRPKVELRSILAGGCAMAFAISGMHYTGMYSMRMAARIEWNPWLVAASVLIAMVASFSALFVAIRMRSRGRTGPLQGTASVLMGCAIAGMHYTGMAAATFVHTGGPGPSGSHLLASSGLAVAVTVGTVLILGFALASSAVERALSARTRQAEEISRLYRASETAMSDLQMERDLRDRFMSALAHDLRTPLTAVMMSTQLADRNSANPELVRRHAGRATEGLMRMDGMIQDLLDAHRISAGQPIPLAPEPCNVGELLNEIVEDMTTVYGKRFTLRCPKPLEATWDVKSMRRAVENLCNNAVKHGSPNGEVTISAHGAPDGSSISLEVHNFGEPIEEEDLKHLFGLFQRGRGKHLSRGWGLGLTIVKGIAEAHGGRVQVRSSRYDGTTFTLSAPARVRGAEGEGAGRDPDTPVHSA
jgi:NO-binding membrane sensor protein with MHYT domain/nitrogen-specific signal transduction histidine kinase